MVGVFLQFLPSYDTLNTFPVAMSVGSHPFPSRTRKLSPPEPMVLRGKPRGRVGRCRIFFEVENPDRRKVIGVFAFCGQRLVPARSNREGPCPSLRESCC